MENSGAAVGETGNSVSESQIAAIRHFNRLYTRMIGVLDQHLLESPYSLTEARVLFELAHSDNPSAGEIGGSLGLDAGYLSRIVQKFVERGLITRTPSPADRRQFGLTLTAEGHAAFAKLNESSQRDVAKLLARLSKYNQERLVDAMKTIEHVLHGDEAENRRIILRPHRPGDIGWMVQQNGVLYASEYGWDITYEALVAEIAAQFLKAFDPRRERCWIAERGGERLGSVFLVRQSDEVAKLRLLLVHPSGRGIGLGRTLVDECIAFARTCGYRKITLWTQSILLAARHIYKSAGFVQVASEPHRSFGHDLIGETWELELRESKR
jgi:DNA-binding MarR family transcriptional regulator/GNAT superfamily N-acetyltransferase